MAIDKTGIWNYGESCLWYSPNSTLDAMWSYGESAFLDEYVAIGGLSIPVVMAYYRQRRN